MSIGTSANAKNFQAYILEGIARWNADRAAEALQGEKQTVRSYKCELKHAVNLITEKVFGQKEFPNYQLPGKYTGKGIFIVF